MITVHLPKGFKVTVTISKDGILTITLEPI